MTQGPGLARPWLGLGPSKHPSLLNREFDVVQQCEGTILGNHMISRCERLEEVRSQRLAGSPLKESRGAIMKSTGIATDSISQGTAKAQVGQTVDVQSIGAQAIDPQGFVGEPVLFGISVVAAVAIVVVAIMLLARILQQREAVVLGQPVASRVPDRLNDVRARSLDAERSDAEQEFCPVCGKALHRNATMCRCCGTRRDRR